MSRLGRKTELGMIAVDEATRQVKLSQNGTGGHRVLSKIQITGFYKMCRPTNSTNCRPKTLRSNVSERVVGACRF